MKEIVVISGKGGTGKTSITAAFAYLAKRSVVLADCDVDASDLHLILKPEIKRKENFYSSQIATIDGSLCTSCAICYDVCHFNAIIPGTPYKIDTISCEGCGYCEKVCPEKAISMKANLDGQWFISITRLGSHLAHARLGIGAENSGKLVSVVKNVAKQLAQMLKLDTILIDGPPGISCPVISTLSGANFAVIVTEPTVSGLHDLKRVYEIARRFRVNTGVIINKADINKDNYNKIKEFTTAQGITHLADLPYDTTFTKAMTEGKTIIEYAPENSISKTLANIWPQIIKLTENPKKQEP